MTQKKCHEVYASPNVEVATHGFSHPVLNWIPTGSMVYEIIEDRRRIEQEYGVICRGHAYPYGRWNDDVVEALRLCGIVYARTIVSTYNFKMPSDWLRLNPTCHHKDERLNELCDKFINNSPDREPWLFYLWGHSFEFESDDNWNVIEQFFENVANKDDIWYATNIEVYDYEKAFKSLIYSADGTRIYNPSAVDVWVVKHKQNPICIKAGGYAEIN